MRCTQNWVWGKLFPYPPYLADVGFRILNFELEQNDMTTDINLFSPYQLGNLELPNRIVMAPLTRNRAGQGNVPHQLSWGYSDFHK